MQSSSMLLSTDQKDFQQEDFQDPQGPKNDDDNDLIKQMLDAEAKERTQMENNIQPPTLISPMKSASFSISQSKINDTLSQGNRSTTTTGGGLASKIGQAVSRILQHSQSIDYQDADDVTELATLLDELNTHTDLTVKLQNQSKIIKFLNEASDGTQAAGTKKAQGPVVKDYKKEIGKAKSEFGRLGFQSKLRLEMKQLMIDPKVKEIVD